MKSLKMQPNRAQGYLFTFCGLDGCGKTTMLTKLKDYLEKELEHAVEIPIVKADDIQVKTLDVANAYNTMNLQKELADSLREILEVSHTESSVDVSEQQEETGSMYADTAEITEAKDTTGIAEGTEIIEKEEFSEAASQEPEPQTVQETPLWAPSQPVLAQTAEKPEKEADEALTCEHNFMPIDSTQEVLACSKSFRY